MSKPALYLGGAMRNGVVADYAWRREAWDKLAEVYRILDPANGKTYHGTECGTAKRDFKDVEHDWRFCGIWKPDDTSIYWQDRRDVKLCDIGVWNFTALKDGYPCIGSTKETGWANAWDKLIYIIYPEPERLHPFIRKDAAIIFPTPDEAITYLGMYSIKLQGEQL